MSSIARKIAAGGDCWIGDGLGVSPRRPPGNRRAAFPASQRGPPPVGLQPIRSRQPPSTTACLPPCATTRESTIRLSSAINDLVVTVKRRSSPESARIGAAFCAVSSNGRSGLPHGSSGPAGCYGTTGVSPKTRFLCRTLRQSRDAFRQSFATFKASDRTSLALPRWIPVSPCDASRHGLRLLRAGPVVLARCGVKPHSLRQPF